jgi:hypothetical protein
VNNSFGKHKDGDEDTSVPENAKLEEHSAI